MKNLKIKHYGTIELGSKVRVSDPCYGTTTWCNRLLDNVSEGIWDCYAVVNEQNRVAFLAACKDGCRFAIANEQCVGVVGVDAGVMGVFDEEYFQRTRDDKHADDKWYEENVCADHCWNNAGWMCDGGQGFITSSGDGDGSYHLFVDRNKDGKIIRIAVDFGLVYDKVYGLEWEEK